MRLSDYMAEHKLIDAQVAAQTGIERSVITKLRNGSKRPSWNTARRLMEWSGGTVTPNDFVQIEAAE